MSLFRNLLIEKSEAVPVSAKYCLRFEGTASFTMSYSAKNWNGTVEYSTDNETWTTWASGSTPSSSVLYLRGTGNTQFASSTTAYTTFSFNTTGQIYSYGRLDYLLDYATVEAKATPTMADYTYLYMFKDCTQLVTAPELPATSLTSYCYCQLFYGCTNLIEAPALPATTVATYCYAAMFHSCTSLTTPPEELAATTLSGSSNCCQYMFYGCSSLTTAPILSATILSQYCYRYMFYGCTSLESAPALPATSATQYCYQYMFYGCTSLTDLPDLPATTLANYCYGYMFYNCSNIKLSSTQVDNYTQEWTIPSSGTIGSTATSWAQYMFTGTGGTKTGAGAINTTYYLYKEPVPQMLKFEGTASFTMSYSTKKWDGTVEYSLDNENWTTWASGSTPSSSVLYLRGTSNTRFATSTSLCTTFSFNTTGTISASGRIDYLLDYQSVEAGSEVTMSDYCFYRMFYGCTSLVAAPELPAMTLANYCYGFMFYGCTSLETAPTLPATILATACYSGMFYGCTSLVTAPELPSTTLVFACYGNMFRECTSLVIPPELPATVWADYCYNSMFYDCTSLKVSQSQTGNYTKVWAIPVATTYISSASTNALTGTGGSYTGYNMSVYSDIRDGNTYYLDITGA